MAGCARRDRISQNSRLSSWLGKRLAIKSGLISDGGRFTRGLVHFAGHADTRTLHSRTVQTASQYSENRRDGPCMCILHATCMIMAASSRRAARKSSA
eukprot:7383767-Prymnesium_polylepis.2